jgi:hypothetical protein
MKILFISSDKGGCRYYRCMLPGAELAEKGQHQVLVAGTVLVLKSGEIAAPGPEGEGVRGFDVVVLQRWMGQDAPRVIRAARACGQAVINDVDDWFFGIPTSNAGFQRTHKRNDPSHNVEHYRKALAASSAITVSTPYLAERLRTLGRPVHMLRNLIDLKRWEPARVSEHSLVVGWYGHTSYRAPGDLAQLRGILGPFFERHPQASFLHGGNYSEENRKEVAGILGIDIERMIVRPQRPIEELPRLLQGIDIGVAPLEDCPFNRAKSWIKPLEFAAAGIPAVGSALPEYITFDACGIARKPRDWVRQLEQLADPANRLRAAQEARARARELDIAHGWQAWERAYMNTLTDAMAGAIG